MNLNYHDYFYKGNTGVIHRDTSIQSPLFSLFFLSLSVSRFLRSRGRYAISQRKKATKEAASRTLQATVARSTVRVEWDPRENVLLMPRSLTSSLTLPTFFSF